MTIIDHSTGEVLEISADDARRLTDKIRIAVEGVWHLIEEAYTTRAWSALGYKSWDDYCTREFGTSRIRLPREERPEVVASLRDAGLSLRAIASATGADVKTIRGDIAGVGISHTSLPTFAEHMANHQTSCGTSDITAPQDPASAEGTTEGAGASEPPTPRPPVVGIDGKTYPATTRRQPARPRPIAETSLNTIESYADRAAREAKKLTADQIRRVKPNAAEWIGGIRESIEVLSDLIRSLEEN